jgi:hypothetical protein
MSTTIYLEPSQVPPLLRGGYNGQKYRVQVCERVHIPCDAGLSSGGSRDTFYALRTVDGSRVALSDSVHAPWDSARQDQDVALQPGIVVVKHTMFCGKDLGLTFYVRPEDAAPMLPAPAADLSRVQQMVLDYTSGRKSSYNGQNRYEMARADWSHGYMKDKPESFPSVADWDAAKSDLIARGMLNKAGAITPAGRNAAKRI